MTKSMTHQVEFRREIDRLSIKEVVYSIYNERNYLYCCFCFCYYGFVQLSKLAPFAGASCANSMMRRFTRAHITAREYAAKSKNP